MYKLFILTILYCSLALVIPNTLDLVKRKGGGGGGGGGRGGGSVSSSSSSSSGSSARTGSSSSGSTSNTGSSGSSTSVGTVSRTSSNYRSGTYNGGAVSSYRGGVPYAGLGVPLLIGGSLGAAAWYYPLYNGYGYGQGRPPNTNYYVYNSSLGVPVTYTNTTTNGTESNPVICLCQDGTECGCGPVNSTVIEQTPQSLLLTAPLNGTTTLVINGTLATSSSTRLYPSVLLIALTLYSSF